MIKKMYLKVTEISLDAEIIKDCCKYQLRIMQRSVNTNMCISIVVFCFSVRVEAVVDWVYVSDCPGSVRGVGPILGLPWR